MRDPSRPLFAENENPLDLSRMYGDKLGRIRAKMEDREIEAAWLLGAGHLRYAIGGCLLPADGGLGTHQRVCALIVEGTEHPYLFTPYPELAPESLPTSHIHGPLDIETGHGVESAEGRIRELVGHAFSGKIAIDEYSAALYEKLPRLFGPYIEDAARLIGSAKLCKTADEVECVRRAQAINECAMLEVQAAVHSGQRQSDLTALFFSRIYALGATANGIDPIWQVMAPSIADGPWTVHGDVAFPTCTTDRRLNEGDVLWVDTGIDYHGYQSDFGRTFLVGKDGMAAESAPSDRQRDQWKRWHDVVTAVLEMIRPGTTGRDLTRRAIEVAGGRKPWLDHFYLIHGLGTEAAEPPFIGTDLGDAFDESLVLEPGMLCVLEPAIWDDGFAGYRAEEVVAVTETGYQMLSSYSYSPYALAADSSVAGTVSS